MKKLRWLLVMIALVFAFSAASCGSKKEAEPEAFPEDLVPLDEEELKELEEGLPEEEELKELEEEILEEEKDQALHTEVSDNTIYGKKKKNKNKTTSETKKTEETAVSVTEDGTYTSKEEVAEYIHLFGKLPSNYITKNKARDLGWDSRAGNLGEVAPGKSIGGDKFGNYDKLLPEKSGRTYRECDIDFDGSYRNAKRIIYSNDGLIFYTEDHYQTFEQLY